MRVEYTARSNPSFFGEARFDWVAIYRDRCEGDELCGWSAYEFGQIVELLELYCDDIGVQVAVVQKATSVCVHPITKILSVKRTQLYSVLPISKIVTVVHAVPLFGGPDSSPRDWEATNTFNINMFIDSHSYYMFY